MNIKRALIDITDNELSQKIEQELQEYCKMEMGKPTNINLYVYENGNTAYQVFLIKPDAPRNQLRLYREKSHILIKNPENTIIANTNETIKINTETNLLKYLI